jgi:hippurate hydrolase
MLERPPLLRPRITRAWAGAVKDLFEVTITGRGTHGALPHTGIDPVMIGSQLVTAWQSIVSRNVDPMQPAVISATTFQSGDSYNVIPERAVIRGSIRTISTDVQQTVKQRFIALTREHSERFRGDGACRLPA